MAKTLTEMAVEIITAQLSHRDMSADEIADALKNTFGVLRVLKETEIRRGYTGSTTEGEPPNRAAEKKPYSPPSPPVREKAEAPLPKSVTAKEKAEKRETRYAPNIEPMASIQEDKIICLECGREFRQISHTHLKRHGLTPKEYRKKYRLSAKQPLTAHSLSEQRKQKAREIGLGSHLKSLREEKQKSNE
ncbi:MAG: MucR family transcriptional regulator [Desulforhabdus sp.]|jgi:predicted transcriptional regulator|nr:MucR family transcriptional regulator [Desulforhabdus sp.]